VSIFVNRTLDLKKIKAIGFDMDHTLVRYNFKNFEGLTYNEIINKLINLAGYPTSIKKLKFDHNRVVRGLVMDKINGNLLKVSSHGRVKSSAHGTKRLSKKEQTKKYKNTFVDLNEGQFDSVDTVFSLAQSCLFAQLVDLKDQGEISENVTYEDLANDITHYMDLAHRDDTLKSVIRENIADYIILDEQVVKVLESFKKIGKKLLIITNSDYSYSKVLLDYAINPFLKNHKTWDELFEIVITLSAKPRFFTDDLPFLKIDPETNTMTNQFSGFTSGIYQGGSALKLQENLKLSEEQILYLGDHIYGDILNLKKTCNWRTALVIEDLEDETNSLKSSIEIHEKIETLMTQKATIDKKLHKLPPFNMIENDSKEMKIRDKYFSEIEKVDNQLTILIKDYQTHFNPYWGEIMRAGSEHSLIAGQVEKYACIYMAKVSDFLYYSPQTYFRTRRRMMAHEFFD
jgi:HAD superfamily 5'-nucleotidase-like hydrolase